jgi:hypothetical protein
VAHSHLRATLLAVGAPCSGGATTTVKWLRYCQWGAPVPGATTVVLLRYSPWGAPVQGRPRWYVAARRGGALFQGRPRWLRYLPWGRPCSGGATTVCNRTSPVVSLKSRDGRGEPTAGRNSPWWRLGNRRRPWWAFTAGQVPPVVASLKQETAGGPPAGSCSVSETGDGLGEPLAGRNSPWWRLKQGRRPGGPLYSGTELSVVASLKQETASVDWQDGTLRRLCNRRRPRWVFDSRTELMVASLKQETASVACYSRQNSCQVASETGRPQWVFEAAA